MGAFLLHSHPYIAVNVKKKFRKKLLEHGDILHGDKYEDISYQHWKKGRYSEFNNTSAVVGVLYTPRKYNIAMKKLFRSDFVVFMTGGL